MTRLSTYFTSESPILTSAWTRTAAIEAIVDEISSSGRATLWFFCEAKTGQPTRATTLFEAWIKQLLIHIGNTSKIYPPDVLCQLYKFYNATGLVPDLEDVIEIFTKLFIAIHGTVCIVDGVDDFEDEDFTRIVTATRDLARLNEGAHGRFFFTSRRDLDSNLAGIVAVHIPISLVDVKSDLQHYVTAKTSAKIRRLTTDKSLMEKLRERLVTDAEGM